MKKKIIMGVFALGLLSTGFMASAQEKKETVGEKIDKTATKVGNKTAEVAVKGTSKIADKTWKGMMAPDGSNVYINNKNQKYYINKKGAKVYLKASQIKARPQKAD
jgi:hydrogenase maturation factor